MAIPSSFPAASSGDDPLTAYKTLAEVEFRKELPKNMTSKILRRALRAEEDRKRSETVK